VFDVVRTLTSPTMLTDISYQSLEFIALNLRECDKVEIFNLLDTDSPLAFAWEAHRLLRNSGRGRIAWHNGRPAAWIGLIEMIPGVFQITMGGTDDLPKVAFECMRWARETIAEFTQPPFNGWRLYCDSRTGPEYEEQHRFLRALGAKEEGPPVMKGKDRGVYQCFVWLFGDNGHVAHGRAFGGAQ
jgi:hypothetical protein